MRIEDRNGFFQQNINSFQQDSKIYSEPTSEKLLKEIAELKADIEASEPPSIENLQKLQQKMNELSLVLDNERELNLYIQGIGIELREQSEQQCMQKFARMLGGV